MNEKFSELQFEIGKLRKEAESYDTSADLCRIAYDLGKLTEKINTLWLLNQINAPAHTVLMGRIGNAMMYIRQKEVRE